MLELIPFREISSLAIWIPLVLSCFKLRGSGIRFRWFSVFLLAGALVDGLGWFLFWRGQDFFIHSFFQLIYLVFEALFFIGLAFSFLKVKNGCLLKNLFGGLVILVFLIRAWVVFFSYFNPAMIVAFSNSLIMVISSFLMAFALLQLAEQDRDLMNYSWFWILSGIFFYCFGTFFVDMLIYSSLVQEIWPIRNVVNIIQYGFFVVGLTKSEKG